MGKRVQRGDYGKLIPVNMGGGGKGVIEYYRALWKDQVSFKLRKHLIQGSGGGGRRILVYHIVFMGRGRGSLFGKRIQRAVHARFPDSC